MNVEVIVRIDGREAVTLNHKISGQPIDIEQQTEALKDRLGQVVLPEAFYRFDGELRRPCCCGRKMHRKGTRTTPVMSQSGEIDFKRRRYRCPECRCCCTPADALVWCGKHRITRHLGKQICQLATLEHFTRLEQLMADQYSVHIGHDDMLQLVHDVGTVVDVQRQTAAKFAMESPSRIDVKVRSKQVYVSCDGILYCINEREPCPADPDTNRLLWRQMRVGCVYWQDQHEHWKKQVMWGQEDLATFAASLFRLACEHGYREADEKIFTADGGEWCWGIQDKYFADADGGVADACACAELLRHGMGEAGQTTESVTGFYTVDTSTVGTSTGDTSTGDTSTGGQKLSNDALATIVGDKRLSAIDAFYSSIGSPDHNDPHPWTKLN